MFLKEYTRHVAAVCEKRGYRDRNVPMEWAEISRLLDEDIETVLPALPRLLENLALKGTDWREYGRLIARYIDVYEPRLLGLDLYKQTIEALWHVLCSWLGDYAVSASAEELSEFQWVVEGGAERDEYLEGIFRMEHTIEGPTVGEWSEGTTIGESMLRRWMERLERPEWAAHFVDMCVNAAGAYFNKYVALYESAALQRILTQEKQTLAAAVAAAKPLWSKVGVPAFYIEAVDGYLFGNRKGYRDVDKL